MPKFKLETQAGAMNREGWLTEVASLLSPLFPDGLVGKKYRVTCGWPSVQGLGAKVKRVGECHAAESSKDGHHELFISPLLDDPLEVAGTLAHEMAHVGAGLKAAHGKEFIKVCQYVGLTKGKPRSIMPGTLLEERIKALIKPLPTYPHKGLVPVPKPRREGTGPVTLVCSADGCGCKVTLARRWLDEIPSLPVCGCGAPFKQKDDQGE